MKHKRLASNQNGEINLLVVVCAVLGVFVLIFAGLFIGTYLKEQNTAKNVNAKVALGYKAGQEAGAKTQKETDIAASKAAEQNPYRSYVAPTAFGEFTIKFPKSWSSSVAENLSASTQVDLIANPDFIKILPDNRANYALRAGLINSTYSATRLNYDQRVKAKKLTATSVKVSGIDGTRYTGEFKEKKTGVIILVPVRDKTIFFSTENTKYQPEFEATLAQSTIKP